MVMYRDFATRTARRLGILGDVYNDHDGTVRVVAEGPKDTLTAYIGHLERGSLLAHVEAVRVEWVNPTGEFTTFSIRY